MEVKELDCILVPIGLSVMIAYHLWLVHMILTQPRRTVFGITSCNRQIWVRSMMQDPASNGSLAVQTLSYYVTISTVMATTAIVLGTLTTTWMNNTFLEHKNTTKECHFIKLIMAAVCFLLVFLFGLLSSRYYCHSIMVINIPSTIDNMEFAMEYVTWVLKRGGMFWSLGMRAYYFSIPVSLWAFGPISMIVSCIALIGMLYFLDFHNDPPPTWI